MTGVLIGVAGVKAGAGAFCDCCGPIGDACGTIALGEGAGTADGILESAGLATFPS